MNAQVFPYSDIGKRGRKSPSGGAKKPNALRSGFYINFGWYVISKTSFRVLSKTKMLVLMTHILR